jgi:predicted nucleic acid-binding protein
MISVIDASAAVEYLLRTDLGERIGPLLEASMLVAPELLDVEVLAVLRREAQSGRLSVRRATEVIEDLHDWEVERISHRHLLDEAWALRDRVTAYDALYVAAARLRGATLITADGPLARTPALGVAVHNVRLL